MLRRLVLPVLATLGAYAAVSSPLPAAPAGPPVKPVPRPSEEPPADAAAIHEAHKEYRTRHCASWLRWSSAIADAAQARADRLAKDCKLRPGDSKYGENLWSGTAGSYRPQKMVDSWYAESAPTTTSGAGYSARTARFTQLVWVGSRDYGCATASARRRVWVCLRSGAELEGEFERNVLPKTCKE